MNEQITRVTMIKIANEDHIPIALKGFETFTKNQKKVSSHWPAQLLPKHAGNPYKS